jgi:hypothetical protein
MTGLGALATIDPGARWSVAVPLAAALPLIIATIRHQEKSWHGEIAASLVCAGAAVPIAMAAGATTKTAAAVAIPFALLFVASTLAVRVVILRVRRGGDPKATAATRRAALSFTVGSAAILALLTASDLLAASFLIAAAPGLLIATAIAYRPPAPSHLRTLGWTLVAVSVMTAIVVVAMA